MVRTDRSLGFGGLTSGLARLTVPRAAGQTTTNRRAASLDVAPSAAFNPLVPRRSGEAVAFNASLDRAAIKATSGG